MYHEYFDGIAEHFRYISENYKTVHLHEMAPYFQNTQQLFPDKTIVLTFDDAYQDLQKIVPLLSNHNLKATVCVPTGYIAEQEEERQKASWEHGSRQPLLTWDELSQLLKFETIEHELIIELIPHSVWHEPLDKDTINSNILRLRFEIGYSRDTLAQRLGIPASQFFCLPGGAGCGESLVRHVLHENKYISALKAGYSEEEDKVLDCYCTPRWNAQTSDPRVLLEGILRQIG
jgi:peptidoglycan/xylan/chitin deacetylase (PgdA/CDA1 family)